MWPQCQSLSIIPYMLLNNEYYYLNNIYNIQIQDKTNLFQTALQPTEMKQ